MPRSTTERSVLLFAANKDAVSADKYARWSHLTTAQKAFWQNKAREIIYPDLRGAYNMHAEMIHTMSMALYECYIYEKQGGGDQPQFKTPEEHKNNTSVSIFDALKKELADGYP
ncbi:hypothetical protein EVB87_076 [Rhizobium phage RHph_N28_1]|nr:hypothetical protein EVB87_076 [Rhizobium phage RHph_N28_1]QIG74104.1 hypothetical protein EVC07_076 [Rhizobium phage RHph_N42]QXV73763.1 hypothetical protein [Rhizobium phage RHph_N46]